MLNDSVQLVVHHLVELVDSLQDFTARAADNFLDLVDDTSPLIVFRSKDALIISENDHFDLSLEIEA